MNIKVDIYLIISTIILFLFKELESFLSFYIFVILHEFAHILVAKLLKVKIIDLSFLAFGVNAKFDFKSQKLKESIIAIAGPFLSLILVYFYPKYRIQNLFIFITNMIPIYPLDGGRIFKNIIMRIFGNIKGRKIYNSLLKIFIILLMIVNVILIVFLKNYNFIFFTFYIFQMAGDEIKKDKLRAQLSSILNIEI